MSIWTSLEPASATVDPGGAASVTLTLRNTGDVVEEYRILLVGEPARWARAEPAALKLYPGTGGTVELTFAPPRSPDAAAGPHPYGVKVVPAEQPDATTVVEGMLSITPFTELHAELVPQESRGRWRGRPRLAVDNLGNTEVTVSLTGREPGDRLEFELEPSSLQIAPGRAAFAQLTLRPKQVRWTGGRETAPFSVAVQRAGTEPLAAEGTFVHAAVLPRWTARVLMGAAALTAAAVAFWLSVHPTVATRAREVAATASQQAIAPGADPGAAPAPSAQPSLPPAPLPTQGAPAGQGGSGAGGGTGGGSGGGGGG
ncbi:hypothetical protein ACFW1A_40320, partial [Kitasatospora sp. NPDC058965]